ncbi:hypothetical protein [Brevibacterium daeguense]|uniref:hypothetical protein n=1 Tax=Brevibacterium daeguense TaxID=909936 RepID=UPI001F3D0851|nr:hypothetical protein [Brevibacterium daeguense]
MPDMVSTLPGTSASQRREAPLGRAALWLCLGLGAGLGITALLIFLITGAIPTPGILDETPALQLLALIWPAVLALAAAVLLAVGSIPRAVHITRGAAEPLLRSGVRGLARVVRIRATRTGAQCRVKIALDARLPGGRAVPARLQWTVDPVDAEMLRLGAVIPVRMDPAQPRRIVLDSRADSRTALAGVDVGAQFSRKATLRTRIRMMKTPSRWSLLLGLLGGILTALIG